MGDDLFDQVHNNRLGPSNKIAKGAGGAPCNGGWTSAAMPYALPPLTFPQSKISMPVEARIADETPLHTELNLLANLRLVTAADIFSSRRRKNKINNTDG